MAWVGRLVVRVIDLGWLSVIAAVLTLWLAGVVWDGTHPERVPDPLPERPYRICENVLYDTEAFDICRRTGNLPGGTHE